MASRQSYLGHSKQVDGTEEVLHREPPHHLQAERSFLTCSLNGVEPAQIQQQKTN